MWETYCGLKDLANVPLFSELTYIHSTKTSSLLYFSYFFEFFLFVLVEVSNSNNCMLKLLWVIYLLSIFLHNGTHVHFLLELRVKSETESLLFFSESYLITIIPFWLSMVYVETDSSVPGNCMKSSQAMC